MKKCALGVSLVFLGMIAAAALAAQSNEVIDDLLAQEIARPAEVSYIVLAASGELAEDASRQQALQSARERGLLGDEEAVDLGRLSFLLMTTFDVPGGIMYSLLPGPRYATRELAFHGLIPGRPHPDRVLSGFEALQLVERFLNWRTNG